MARPVAAEPPVTVSQIRFGIQGERTRIVLDTSRRVAFAATALADPWRLVVELPEADWQLQPGALTVPRGLARASTTANPEPGHGQLVVTSAGPFRVATTMVLPPAPPQTVYRIVIDLEPLKTDAGAPPALPAVAPRAMVAAAPPSPPAAAAPVAAAVVVPAAAAYRGRKPPLPVARPTLPLALLDPPTVMAALEPARQLPAAAYALPSTPLEPPLESPEPDEQLVPIRPPRVPALPVPRPEPSLSPAALTPGAGASTPGSREVQTAAIPAVVLRSGLPPGPGATLPSGMRRTIVLDPGHGGIDPGTIGVDGIEEKNVVLAMAEELRDVLESTGRYHVVLTRNGDTFIPLRDRIRIAHEAGAQLFISLHADSIARPHFRGTSVYTLSDTASDAEAELLASKENKADIIAGTDLSNHDPVVTSILIDLAQRDTSNRSIAFADMLSARLGEVTQLVRKHRRFAGFAVLKSPDLPSVLIELGYLSSPEDAADLVRPEWRNRMSRSIQRAIDRFFQPSHS